MAGAALLSSFTYAPILAREFLSANEFFVAVMVGSVATASFISSYIFGRAGDIYSRRLVLRIGLASSALSCAFLLIATSPEVLYIIRVVNGFTIGMYPGSLAAYAYESDLKMGRFASFGAIGWGIGNILAGYVAVFNIYYAFLISTLFFTFAFSSAMTLPSIPRIKVHVPLFPIETFKRNAPLFVAILIRHSSARAMWTLWSLYLIDLGADTFMVGIVWAVNTISQVIFMMLLTDRFDCQKLILFGFLMTAVGFIMFGLATNVFEVLPSQIFVGLAWACMYVGALKYVNERNVEKSTASGLLTSTMSIGGIIGPMIVAIFYLIWPGYLPIILNGIIMSLIAFTVFWFFSKDKSNAKSSQSDSSYVQRITNG
jgi:MFS family permease